MCRDELAAAPFPWCTFETFVGGVGRAGDLRVMNFIHTFLSCYIEDAGNGNMTHPATFQHLNSYVKKLVACY